MKWLEISVYTADEGMELVSGALMGAGLVNLAIEESHAAVSRFLSAEAKYWDFADADRLGADEPRVIAYVADLPENERVPEQAKEAVERLRGLGLPFDLGPLTVAVRTVDEEDWANNWKRHYKPMAIGRRLMIVPSWETPPAANGRKTLVLDPGMAFGTGAHQTTRMCLELLEGVVHGGNEMIDFGCGSGILSIAGLLLGASSAVAVDIDPVARDIAEENLQRNDIDPARYRIYVGDVLTDGSVQNAVLGSYDLLVANIVADVIIRLAPFARRCARSGAPFIVSGIIGERRDEVLAALKGAGFTVECVLESDDWIAVLSRA